MLAAALRLSSLAKRKQPLAEYRCKIPQVQATHTQKVHAPKCDVLKTPIACKFLHGGLGISSISLLDPWTGTSEGSGLG